MPIADVEAVRFANEELRPAADQLAQLYYLAKSVRDQWFARGMAARFPNTSDVVEDGSANDGRPRITGADVNNLITRLDEIVTSFEAGSNAKLNTILKVAVNPMRNTP